MREHNSDYWEIPYLPIDPADVGRQYEPIIRINSQSGKGGAAFVMQNAFGYNLPKAMHPEFGALVKAECDRLGREVSADELFGVFRQHYIDVPRKVDLRVHSFVEDADSGAIHRRAGFRREGNGPVGQRQRPHRRLLQRPAGGPHDPVTSSCPITSMRFPPARTPRPSPTSS